MSIPQNKEKPEHKKTVAVVAHCILNQNTVAYGLASHEGAVKDLVNFLISKSYGIIQLPCPESTYLGQRRWWMSKEQYSSSAYKQHCKRILEPIIMQLKELISNGVSFVIIGIKGSPSCGIFTTTSNPMWRGDPRKAGEFESTNLREPGTFMKILLELIQEENVPLPDKLIEIDHHEIKEKGLSIDLIQSL